MNVRGGLIECSIQAGLTLGGLTWVCLATTSLAAPPPQKPIALSPPAIWKSVGAGGGGSFFEPSFNPDDPNEIWVATDQSDEYHSTNGGVTWTVPNFASIQGNHVAPVQYTNKPGLLFALGHSNALQTSDDGGKMWHPLTNNPAGSAESFIVNFDNPDQFFLSNRRHIYFTRNRGGSYSTLKSSSAYVAGAFFDGTDIYLATDHELLSSTDGGRRFTSSPLTGIPADEGIFSLAGATAQGIRRLVAVTADAAQVKPGAEGSICYHFKSVYSADFVKLAGNAPGPSAPSWTRLTGIPVGIDPAFVTMMPGDISHITLAGGSAAGAPTVIQTSDAGATWTSIFNTKHNANIQTGWQGEGGVHSGWGFGEFAMGFAENRGVPSEMMLTDEAAAYLTRDGGASWRAVYVSPDDLNPPAGPTPGNSSYHGNGLENTSSWYLTFPAPSKILASFTDITGISSADGGNSWSFNANAGNSYNTTYQIIAQPRTGDLYAAVSDTHDIYQWDAYQTNPRIDAGKGAVLLSHNGGSKWTLLHDFKHPVVWQAIDPNHPNTMYVSVPNSRGAGGIYVTRDLDDGVKAVWKQLPAAPRTEGHPLGILVLNDGTLVATYAGTLNKKGTFEKSAGVFVSSDQGATWADATATVPAMQYFDRDITIDPNDPAQNTWYVGVWEASPNPFNPEGGLYKTSDRGRKWVKLPGLPDKEFSAAAFNPTNTREMYVTTGDDGLWYTADARVWPPKFEHLSNYPFQAPQRVFFNPYKPGQVWVTSFGYGLVVGE